MPHILYPTPSHRILTCIIDRNLLDAGAEVNARDLEGWTPLHAAAHWNLSDAAKVLTEYGADFDAHNRNVSS